MSYLTVIRSHDRKVAINYYYYTHRRPWPIYISPRLRLSVCAVCDTVASRRPVACSVGGELLSAVHTGRTPARAVRSDGWWCQRTVRQVRLFPAGPRLGTMPPAHWYASFSLTYWLTYFRLYIGWPWRNFFISAVFRHSVGQAVRNVCYSDVSRCHFLLSIR